MYKLISYKSKKWLLKAPASQGLANQMVAYWAQFAYTGNPNVVGLPTWPLYAGKQTSSVMLLKPGALFSIPHSQVSSFYLGAVSR